MCQLLIITYPNTSLRNVKVIKVSKQYLVNAEVRVGGDDGSSRKIHTLPRQVSSETTLLALQPLDESPAPFLRLQNKQKMHQSKAKSRVIKKR
jgi:hypothetical protein